jgi:hypothetical protein
MSSIAKIGAGLHFDELERDLARVFQAVRDSKWNIGRLVLCQDDFVVTVRNECCAFHDDPVLGTVMMHLQAQPRARAADDAFDLDAVAAVDAFV